MGSHECSASGNPPRIILGGRDGYSLTRKSEKEPRNGSTRTDRYRCRSVAPSVAKGAILTNATLFAPGMATGSLPGDLRTPMLGSAHAIYGGGKPGEGTVEDRVQPRGTRDKAPSIVIQFSNPPH